MIICPIELFDRVYEKQLDFNRRLLKMVEDHERQKKLSFEYKIGDVIQTDKIVDHVTEITEKELKTFSGSAILKESVLNVYRDGSILNRF